MLRDLLREGDYLVKIDLKDAYLTVPIWKGHQKYLRFLWKDTMLEFACLPFGLATAPRVFTKLMKPVVAMLRQRGVRLIIYLDDILIMAESEDLVLHQAASILNLLESLGFVINYKKSQLVPSQQIEFLGFLIDSVTMSVQLSGEKLRKIRKQCRQLLNLEQILLRELSEFLGLLTFSIQAVFPDPLHYRHLQRLKSISDAPSSSKEGNCLVERPPSELEWPGTVSQASGLNYRNRCVPKRLGGINTKASHKLPRILAGSFTINTFCKTKVVAHVKLLMDNTSAVAYINKIGGDPFPIISQFGNRFMDMVSRERDSDVRRTSPRGSECKSGLGIQGRDRSQRLEIESNPAPGTFTEMGALGGRSVCISTDMPITTVCELETRPMVHSNRFLFNELAEN